jgi:DNA-directed RNA polymerase specialized sigma24 family protein
MTSLEMLRVQIIAQELRITEFQRLRTAITEHMKDASQGIITDLLNVYSERQIARMLHCSPETVKRLHSGTMECSHELFLRLFAMWNKLQPESK